MLSVLKMNSEFKENFHINTQMGSLALDSTATTGKTKAMDKKKSKSNYHKDKSKVSAKNSTNNDSSAIAQFERKDQRPFGGSSKYQGKAQKQKQGSYVKGNHRNNKGNGELKIIIDNQDMEICKKTAIELHQIREAVSYDLSLQQHLTMMAYASNHFMLEQQQKAFYVQERLRQQQIATWLSTKSENERSTYLDRLKQGIP